MLAGGSLVGTLNQTKTSNLLELFGKYIHGAEGETRTRMGLLPLDPEPNVFTLVHFSMTIFDYG